MKNISGGVCAAKGFEAAGVACGLKKSGAKDLAVILCERRAAAACVYTQNLVKSAPIYVTMENVSDGYAQAVIVNSGNANACTETGAETARAECGLMAECFGIDAKDVIVASTGVIGREMPIEPFETGIPMAAASLTKDGSGAASAIMTTDLRRKEIAVEFELGGTICRVGGMAKGSGMIHPNMATMLCFITTDADISPQMLQSALSGAVCDTFNMISVDGDTSTNDMVSVLASGLAGNAPITAECADYAVFCDALNTVTGYLSCEIARDGEGATKLLTCGVTGAKDKETAKAIAKSVIRSPLVKTAMFGADANWGRVLCAVGYAGVKTDVGAVTISFASRAGRVLVCENGRGVDFSEDTAKTVLSEDEVTIYIALADGEGKATAWGCDLSYDYVKINGDYRT